MIAHRPWVRQPVLDDPIPHVRHVRQDARLAPTHLAFVKDNVVCVGRVDITLPAAIGVPHPERGVDKEGAEGPSRYQDEYRKVVKKGLLAGCCGGDAIVQDEAPRIGICLDADVVALPVPDLGQAVPPYRC